MYLSWASAKFRNVTIPEAPIAAALPIKPRLVVNIFILRNAVVFGNINRQQPGNTLPRLEILLFFQEFAASDLFTTNNNLRFVAAHTKVITLITFGNVRDVRPGSLENISYGG
jgi:hypothetical protein